MATNTCALDTCEEVITRRKGSLYCGVSHRTQAAGQRRRGLRTADERRAENLMRWYKMTLDDFDARLDKQGGKCAGCSRTEPRGYNWHVDHDHACCDTRNTCGKCVRGILCQGCNRALGFVNDDANALRGLADYLEGGRS